MVWVSGDTALLPGGRRFFDFAQNDIYFARNDISYTLLRWPFLDTLLDDRLGQRIEKKA